MSDESTVGTSSDEGCESASPSSVCVYTRAIRIPLLPPGPQVKPPSRLQRIIVSEEPKATQLGRQPSPVPIVKFRRNRLLGKLALMLQVPDDVVREIAKHLLPLDLLNLARSTRALRGMLMSKSARPIWRAALDALGIPKCPSDINEPQLISLMFEESCHVCRVSRPRLVVDYGLRVRLCYSCFSLNVIRGSQLAKEMKFPLGDDTIYRLCAYESDAFSRQSYIVRPDISTERFFRPDFIDVVGKYMSFVPGSAAQKQFVEERKKSVEETLKHGAAIDDWFESVKTKKKEDNKLKRKLRGESILKRLRELGYTDEDFVGKSGKWSKLVYQPYKLTEKAWEKTLPQLKDIIHRRREAKATPGLQDRLSRRRAELGDYYRDYCESWAKTGGEGLPINYTELQELPEVNVLLGKETEINEDEWSEIGALLPEAFRAHGRRIRRDCAMFILDSRQKAGLAPILVGDASDPIDTILNHPSAFISKYEDESEELETYDELLAFFPDRTWPNRYPPLPRVPKYVEALIRSLHWPETVTMQFAKSLGAIFVCNCCPPWDQKGMKWKELVIHFCTKEESYDKSIINMTPQLGPIVPANDHDIDARDDLALLVPEIEEEGRDERQTA
ncbi:hypothetical protein M0805_000848 [Coniferiporia weirii]|nr:hypothetical protein M0805_000848 [Coniferiporia weirii]